MYIEITPDDYRVQFRYQSDPDYDSEIIDFAKLKQDLVITLADDVADKTFADIAFAVAHDVAVIVNDTERKVYARLSAYDDGSSYTFDALLTDGRGVWTVTNEDAWSYELIPIGGGGGTGDHTQLTNRDAANQHPISAITGLESALEGKQPSGDYATTQELDALADIVENKQNTIEDLESIREGAALGATALQEHQSLAAYRTASAQDIIDASKIGDAPSDNKQYARKNGAWAEVESGGNQYELAANKVTSLSSSSTDTQYPSAKATYDAINPAKGSAIPAGGILPNKLYTLGTLSGAVTISLATPADANICNHYFFTFDTGATAPTITWDATITSWMGGSAPTINANKHYEVSVLNGVGAYMEV